MQNYKCSEISPSQLPRRLWPPGRSSSFPLGRASRCPTHPATRPSAPHRSRLSRSARSEVKHRNTTSLKEHKTSDSEIWCTVEPKTSNLDKVSANFDIYWIKPTSRSNYLAIHMDLNMFCFNLSMEQANLNTMQWIKLDIPHMQSRIPNDKTHQAN